MRQLTLCSKNNQITLPEDVAEVEALNLGNNSLQELPLGLGSSLNNLRILVLRRNKFSAVPRVVFELVQLVELDMSHNCLRSLSEGVGELRGLKKLCVSHNKILHLPDQISELQLLEELDHKLQRPARPPQVLLRPRQAADSGRRSQQAEPVPLGDPGPRRAGGAGLLREQVPGVTS